MPPGNPAHLLKLADREFRQLTEAKPTAPRRSKFKPIRLNAARFDQSGDRKRGAAVRQANTRSGGRPCANTERAPPHNAPGQRPHRGVAAAEAFDRAMAPQEVDPEGGDEESADVAA
jgi:hypothetical protein